MNKTNQHVVFSLQMLLDTEHLKVYIHDMKRKELEKALIKRGWWFLRHGGRHDIWTDGNRQEPIPRHAEINEKLARSILRVRVKITSHFMHHGFMPSLPDPQLQNPRNSSLFLWFCSLGSNKADLNPCV